MNVFIALKGTHFCLFENRRGLICFQYPVLLVILCHKTKQKYPKSSKTCFPSFFNLFLMHQQEAAYVLSFIFSILLHDVSHHKTICKKKSPKKLFLFSFQFLFLTYLLNNVSTKDINSFVSAYIYSFMPVLD